MWMLMGVLLLLAPVPAAETDPVGEWKSFISKEGNYEVQMPGTPLENRKIVKLPNGTVFVVQATLEVKKGEYVVGFSEHPDAVVKADTAEKRLDNARNGVLSKTHAKLKSEKQIKLEGHNGRELDLEINANLVVRARLFVINNRMYQLMVVGPRELVASADTGKFLDSFKLVK
jgi:hypothetical protein